MSSEIVKALAVCSELCGGQPVSEAAARIVVKELSSFQETDVLAGLEEMRRTHEGRFSLAAVLKFVRDARQARIVRETKCVICGMAAGQNGYCLEHDGLSNRAANAKPLSWHMDQMRQKVGRKDAA